MLRDPRRYGFFQAVRLLELCHPDAAPLGTDAPAADEVLRLRPDTSFGHPRSSVTDIDTPEVPADGRRRFRVTEALIGLYGLRTPMPSIVGEEILQRSRNDDRVREFLDLFHHRLLSLLYRAWAHSRAEALYREDGQDLLTWILFSLIGLPQELQPATIGAAPLQLTRYAQLFVRRSRPAEGLQTILSDALGDASVRLEPYAARWVVIPASQRNALGRSCSALGRDLQIGHRVFDVGGKFRLRIGPVSYPAYVALAPQGEMRARAGALVQLYVGDSLDYEMEIGIHGPEKPHCRLGNSRNRVRLGVDAWLRSAEPQLSWQRFEAPSGFQVSGTSHGVLA